MCEVASRERVRDRRQRLRSVDEDLDRIARTRRHIGYCPPTCRRFQCFALTDPREAPPVVAADLLRDLLAEPGFDREERPTDRA